METPASTITEYKGDIIERVKADKSQIIEKFKSSNLLSKLNSIKSENNKKSSIDSDDRVKADMRLIFKKLLNSEQLKKADKPVSEENFNVLFGDEDVDDSEEIFEKIVKKVEQDVKRMEEIKKKNPHLVDMDDIFKKPAKRTRKTKNQNTKAVERILDITNKFKKTMAEPNNPEESTVICSDSRRRKIPKNSTIKSTFKSCVSHENYPLTKSLRVYPSWKTTETYTPIFTQTKNPNWVNKMPVLKMRQSPKSSEMYSLEPTTKSSKMYTPQHITNWMNNANNAYYTASSSKSYGSNTAICNSVIDENETFSLPERSPIYTSTPKRSTTVHFKTSPPEYISYSSNGNSTISSILFSDEEDIENFKPSPENHQIYENYSISPLYHKKKSSSDKSDDCLKTHEQYVKDVFLDSEEFDIQNSVNECENNDYLETNEAAPNLQQQQSAFYDDFVKKLNNNIHKNMTVEYSMKIKYY